MCAAGMGREAEKISCQSRSPVAESDAIDFERGGRLEEKALGEWWITS